MFFFFSCRRRHTRFLPVSWARRCVLEADVEKWLYFAKTNNIAVVDSFKEGNIGAATGKLAGAMNNASSGVIDAELGNSIQQNINLLEFIKMEMSDVAGISKQREGQISNRETVGGVERATLQSSHITEWLFVIHEDVKKRVLECFLETAKIALRGRSKKFQYILSDGSMKVMDIDGDEFAPFALAQLHVIGIELLPGIVGAEAHGSGSLGFIVFREQARTGDVSCLLCLQFLFGDEGSREDRVFHYFEETVALVGWQGLLDVHRLRLQ